MMGLDPRIPMGVQPFQIEPQSVAMMRAMQMLGAQRQNQLAQMQMQQMQQAGADRTAQATAQRNALAALPSPDMAASQNALRGGGGPTMANAGRQRPSDPRAQALYQLAQAGIIKPEDYIATLDPNYGREEVKQYVERAGSDNTPEKVGVNRYGDVQGGAFRQPVKMEIMDNGGTRNAYNPYAVQPGQTFAKTMTPGEAASQGTAAARLAEDKRQFGITQAAKATAAAAPAKPLPPAALKMQQESLDAIGISSSINADLGAVEKQITEGKLKFGPVSNLANAGLNMAGMSTEESRNFASFKSTLERLRNESLRLNTGVQTDGDAQRAWNELFQNINDTGLVQQRLTEIKGINKRGAELHRLRVDSVRSNYGAEPLDSSAYSAQPAAVGAKPGAPAAGGWKIERVN